MSVFRINKSPDEERSDKVLRDKLNNHAVTPPSYIWDNVEENLPQQRKRRGFVFWLLPLAACLAGLAVLFLYMATPENASSPLVQNKQANKNISLHRQDEKSLTNKNQNSTTEPQNSNTIKTEIETGGKTTSNVDLLASNKAKPKAFLGNSIYASSTVSKKSNIKQRNNSNPKPINGVDKSVLVDSHVKNLKQENKSNNKNYASNSSGKENQETNKLALNNSGDTNLLNSDSDSTTENLAENKMQAEEKKPENGVKPSENLPKTGKRWAIGLESGLGYAYRFIPTSQNEVAMDVGPNPAPLNNSNTNYNEVESAGFSWKNGLNLRYSLNDKWSVSTGISYTQASIRSKINAEINYRESSAITNEIDTVYIQKNSTGEFSYGSFDGNNANAMTLDEKTITHQNNVKYTFSYIDIPLQLQYRSSAKKTGWFVQAGPGAHFLTGKKAVYTLNDQNNSTALEKKYNTFAISADVYSGISIPLKKFDLQFGPSFNYWFTSLMPTTPKAHLYTAQLKGSIYYKF